MYRPPQCTEREPDGSWEDCTWASGVMLGNAAHAASKYPSTQAEYEALRRASGDSMAEGTGSSIADLVNGMKNRWGWHGTRLEPTTFAGLWALLLPGAGMVVQGRMGAFPFSHRLRRWDPGFVGGHAIYAQREDDNDRVWWMNPEAPASYAGEWVSKSELQAYWTGLPGAEVMLVRVGERKEEVVGLELTDPVPVTGWVVIKDDGQKHAAIDVADKALTWLPAGSAKAVTFMARLRQPWPGHASGVVYGVGDDLAVLLKEDVDDTNVKAPLSQADIDAAIKADRSKAHIVYS